MKTLATTTQEAILRLLKEGLYGAQIAKELKLSKAAISKQIKALEKKGLISLVNKRTSVKTYEVNQKLTKQPEVNQVLQSTRPIYKEQPKPSQSKQRVHRLKRSISLLAKPSDIQGLRKIELNNNIQETLEFEGFILRFTNNLLIVEGIQLAADYEVLSSDLLLYAEKIADATLRHAEARLGLQLGWGTERTTIMEYAFTQQAYMEDAKKAGEKGILTLYWNSITNKPEVWGDLSFNIGELETNKANHAAKLRALVKPIIEERWSVQEQLELNQLAIARLDAYEKDIAYIAKNMGTHIPFMNYTMKVAKGMHPKKPRPIDDKQKRL